MQSSRTKPRIIAIDMDGTLLGVEGKVSARNLAALRAADARGMEIVIATGRRHTYAMKVLRELELTQSNALISSNGSIIRTIGAEMIHRRDMSVETARWLVAHLNDFRSTMVFTFDTVQPDGDDTAMAMVCEHKDELHASIGRWMDANSRYITCVPRLEDALESDAPIQAMLCGTIQRMREAEFVLSQHPKIAGVGIEPNSGTEITIHRTEYTDRDLSIVDILPVGCSKASALEHLSKLRGCTMDDVMAIGDNWNDVPMLRAAGRAVVMANAPEYLKDIALAEGWEMAPSNEEDGVAVAIESALTGAALQTAPMVVS